MSVIQFTVSKCFRVKYIKSVKVILKGRRYYVADFLRIVKSFCRPISPAKCEYDTQKEKVNKQRKI